MSIKLWKYIYSILVLVLFVVIMAVFQFPDSNLHIIACDVGQGDAILATYKNFQVLTDGGIPGGKTVKCLNKYLPFWDREIEVVVNTHPQLDHYGGLIEVFKKYKVNHFVANALDSSAPEYQALKKEVGSSSTQVINPVGGVVIRYDLMSYDIFWPSAEFLGEEGYDFNDGKLGTFTSKRDPNDFSVQAILNLGSFSALVTGDIGHNMADMVIPELLTNHVDYIKIPHHGSKYAMTSDYLKVLMPKVAVISVGKNNRYGHPTTEILDLLKSYGIKTLRTDSDGEVEIISDGKSVWVKK